MGEVADLVELGAVQAEAGEGNRELFRRVRWFAAHESGRASPGVGDLDEIAELADRMVRRLVRGFMEPDRLDERIGEIPGLRNQSADFAVVDSEHGALGGDRRLPGASSPLDVADRRLVDPLVHQDATDVVEKRGGEDLGRERTAKDAAKTGKLPENLLDAFCEVANILAGVLCANGALHVRWTDVAPSLAGLSADDKALIAKPFARVDATIDVDSYGSGKLTIVTAKR